VKNSLGSNWPQRTPTLNIEWGQIDPKGNRRVKRDHWNDTITAILHIQSARFNILKFYLQLNCWCWIVNYLLKEHISACVVVGVRLLCSQHAGPVFCFVAPVMNHSGGGASERPLLRIPVHCQPPEWTSAKNNSHVFLRGAARHSRVQLDDMHMKLCCKRSNVKELSIQNKGAHSGHTPGTLTHPFIRDISAGNPVSRLMTDNLFEKMESHLTEAFAPPGCSR